MYEVSARHKDVVAILRHRMDKWLKTGSNVKGVPARLSPSCSKAPSPGASDCEGHTECTHDDMMSIRSFKETRDHRGHEDVYEGSHDVCYPAVIMQLNETAVPDEGACAIRPWRLGIFRLDQLKQPPP